MISGRIIKGVGGLYFVDTEMGVFSCQARGLFRKQKKTPLVGDLVELLEIDRDKMTGYLHNILKRYNELIRPRVANVDQIIVVFAAASPDINFDLLDRFIAVIEKQGLDIVICINKIDLSNEAFYSDIEKIYSDIGYKVICVSAYDHVGIEELRKAMNNKVSVLAGPSGVGKSSIINIAFPGLSLETGEISRKIERGKHTTRHTEFLPVDGGGYIADTPGFTSLSIDDIPQKDMQHYFREFAPFIGQCRFADCIHISEPDCAVKTQIGKVITEIRYNSYLNFCKRGSH